MALRFYKDQIEMSYVGQILFDDFVAFSKGKDIMIHEGCNYRFNMTFEQMKELVKKKINRRYKFVKTVNSPYYDIEVLIHKQNEVVTINQDDGFNFLQPGVPGLTNSSKIEVIFNGITKEQFVKLNDKCPTKYNIKSMVILIIVIFIIIYFSTKIIKI